MMLPPLARPFALQHLLLQMMTFLTSFTSAPPTSSSSSSSSFSSSSSSSSTSSSSSSSSSTSYDLRMYLSDTTELQKVVFDGETWKFFVAGTDRIFALDGDLNLLQQVSTGPVLDDRRCTRDFGLPSCSDGSSSYRTSPARNFNKVLLIDRENGQLIVCGSIFQGACHTRRLDDVHRVVHDRLHEDPEYFVATNDESLPTVAFVGPGISGSPTLYVGASRSDLLPPRDVPAVSSRSLSSANKFKLSYSNGLDGGSFVKFREGVPDWFKVTYVAGFSFDGFSYFGTNQIVYTPEPEVKKDSRETSKLIQICQKDSNYFSYVEIPIDCRSDDGAHYESMTAALVLRDPGREVLESLGSWASTSDEDAILVAAFANRTRDGSALCLFLVSEVRRIMAQNIRNCFSGQQKYQGLQFGTKVCRVLGTDIGQDYCGEVENNGPLVGTTPLVGEPRIRLANLQVTSMAFAVVQEHTVLFLATSTGHIKKVLVKGMGILSEYEDLVINEGHPLTSIIITTTASSSSSSNGNGNSSNGNNNNNNNNNTNYRNSTMTSVAFLSENKVYLLLTSECWRHSTCERCRGARDPHCGWCSLENKCSLKSECMNAEVENRWLSYKSWQCIHIPRQFVNPVHISVRKTEQITIGVKVLPNVTPPHSFVCIFSDSSSSSSSSSSPSSPPSLSSPAQVSSNEVRCTTPRNLNQFFNHPSVDQVNLTLSIESSQTKVKFLNTSLILFDCSRLRSCLRCTRSKFKCLWCVTSHACSQHDESTCPDEFFLGTPQTCPQLEGRSSVGDVLIPVGVPTSIDIPALYLPEPKKNEFPYECLVHVTTPPVRVPARRPSASLVVCDPFTYSYDGDEPRKAVSLEIVYNNNYYIDDNNAMTVHLYKCETMADDCSSCLNLEEASPRLACVWCDGRCRNKHNCIHGNSVTCPDPVIDEVSPSSGPIQGGTLMTIYGSNLGRRLSDVTGSVLVADVLCDVIESEYVVSKRILCKTGRVDSPRTGTVVVSIGNGAAHWDGSFTYQDPEVYSIHPTVGPLSGGTTVTVHGRELNTGLNIIVRMRDADCSVHFVNDSIIICGTSKVKQPGNYEVDVKFDEARRRIESHNFTFAPDPTIENIFPLSAFLSGGRLIQVFGMNFHSIQRPIMHLHHSSGNKSSPCIIHSEDIILCPVPPLSPSSSSSPSKRHLVAREYLISFTMDGVESVRDLQSNFPNVPSSLTVHPDPIFDAFEEERRVYKGEALMLTGSNLNLACEPTEIKVTIGNESCRVNTLDSTALYCTPPQSQPLPLDSDVTDLPEVKVTVGNLVFHLGYLEYQKAEVLNSDLWITGVAVGGGFLMTIIVVILIVYRHKSSRAHRQFRKLNMQLDVLESNIRNECKQAFAELQTEVSDFTSDLNAVGIPHWDYRTFISKVLVPYEDSSSHFSLHTNGHNKISLNICDEGMARFKALLSQPQFVTNFIQTLEQQKSFTIKDKVRVASLLGIIFHDRLDYLTRILKMLLGDLIKRTVTGNHPKLMLRRTESVVEKLLSNWLSMCLYEDMKGEVGRCLFMLYKAIKHQMFKGPVDCLTHEAKYSLSEDKLLREKIEAQTIMVYVIRPPDMTESVPCKLLDCDSISQAKEKLLDAIYRNAPFSRRPSVTDLDLEWASSQRGRVILKDEDSSTVVIRGWRQMNTIGHYGLHDKALLQLTPRMLTFDGFKDQNNGTLKHSLRMPILTKEDTFKQFHLVCQSTEINPGNSRPKVMSEIYLTRLLATKFTLQQYVDDLFRSILRADTKQVRCIKWLFDFFDDSASGHDITDPQVVHTWKSNSLLLRFWVNIMKNPEFVFDIQKPPIVDSCLSVITQTFMDSCSTHDQKLGKDSPSSKLLFAKDIPRYRKMVLEFYNEIRNLPRMPEDDLLNILALKSQQHSCDLSGKESLQQLYNYAVQYRIELLESLDDDPTARRLNLASQLETIQSYAERDRIFC